MSRITALRSRAPGLSIYLAAFVFYLAIGLYLNVTVQFILGDTLSRVAAAQAVLFSRFPHLSAIGFVFTPLTAIVQLPVVAFSRIWPVITADAISAVIMSASFMAGAVFMLFGITRDRALPWTMSSAVTVLFAINPMIAFYGGNGMSEAPFVFFLLWAVRRLLRWVDSDDVHDLTTCGIALGLAYLVRYDAVAATIAVAVVVAIRTWTRAPEEGRRRRVLLDVVLVAGPAFFAFVVWAATSWLVTGNAFEQFESQYGNAAILRESGGRAPESLVSAIKFPIIEIGILAPGLVVVVGVVALVRSVRRRWWPFVVPVMVFGSVLAFQALTYIRGSTFGFLRFYIVAIPLLAVLALLMVPARRVLPAKRPGRLAQMPQPRGSERPAVRAVASVMAVVAVAVCIPVTLWGMLSRTYAPQEFPLHAVVFREDTPTSERVKQEQRVLRTFATERRLAEVIDALHLPNSSVLSDTQDGFAIITRSRRPKQFVQPSDHDFTDILNDPVDYNIRLLIAVPKTGRGASNALNIRYPTLYENGAGIADLMLEIPNPSPNQPSYRVYRLRR